MHTGYARRPIVKELSNVINFDMPQNYNQYKEIGQMISDEQGSILNFPLIDKEDDLDLLNLLNKKFTKNFGDDRMLKCVPLMWSEISKAKSRVESVVLHLSNKTVQKEKVLEFKKQLVSNK